MEAPPGLQATPLDDGTHMIDVPSLGRQVRTALPADRLQALGYNIAPPPPGPDLRLAKNDEGTSGDDGLGGYGYDVVNGRIPALEKPRTTSDAKATVFDADESGNLKPREVVTESEPRERAPRGVEIGPDGGYVKKTPATKKREGGETEMELRTTPRPAYSPAKASDVRVGYSTHTNGATAMLPGIDQGITGAGETREQALKQRALAEGVTAGEQVQLAGSEAQRYQHEVAAQQARMETQQRMAADYEARQKQLDADRAAEDSIEVDPERYVKNMGVGSKILAAIGLIAGGVQSGLHGGPNQFAEALHQSIREDVQDQRERKAAREKGFAVRQTQLERLTELLHGDQQLAEKELEAKHLARANALMAKIAANSNSREVQANLGVAMADNQQKIAEARGEVNAKFGEQRSEQFKRIVTGGAPTHKLSPAEIQALEGVRAARAAHGRLRATWEAGGKGGVYRTGLGASETSQRMDAQADAAAAALIKARGGRVNPESIKATKEKYLSASPSVIREHLDAADRELADKEAAILAGASGIGAAPGVASEQPDVAEEQGEP